MVLRHVFGLTKRYYNVLHIYIYIRFVCLFFGGFLSKLKKR